MNWYTSQLKKEAKWDWGKGGRGFGYGLMMGAPLIPMMSNVEIQSAQDKSPAQQTQQIEQYEPESQQQQQQIVEYEPQEEVSQHPQEEVSQHPQQEDAQISNYDPFVARVLFAETANASDEERRLVALTMQNRLQHPGFGWQSNKGGQLETLNEVVNEPNAFEAIGDDDNRQWAKSANPSSMTPKEKEVWEHSLALSSGNVKPENKQESRIVYYHDKSIDMPRNWNNKYWKANKEIETPKFIFYSVEER